MKTFGIIEDKEDIFRKLHGYVSYSLLKEASENEELLKVAIGHKAAYFGYSDYGGDIFDRCCCDFKKLEENTFIYENTAYGGAQMVVFGDKADAIVAAETGNNPLYDVADILGFDLDWKLSEVENEEIDDAINNVIHDDIKREMLKDTDEQDYTFTPEDDEWIREWLINHGSPQATSYDWNGSDLVDAYVEWKKKKENGSGKTEESADGRNDELNVATIDVDKETGTCVLTFGNGDTVDFNNVNDAKKFCEKNNCVLNGLDECSNGAKAVTERTDGREWEGRGKDAGWTYLDALKYVKGFIEIKELADGALRTLDADKAFDALRKIRSIAGVHAPNPILPGYDEVMRDIAKI